ncbi:MAG: hypothetical protein BZ133_06780 [Methanosphaera sp. SHI613]|jgi:hypothetical protein|nr:MAG: hypothetical protein BZ133_06780 [Methanosphaera sp. SHI613]
MFTNIKKINGKYVIEKRRYGQTINYGTFNTKEEALEQKKLLMKYNWIKNKSTGYDKEEHFPRYCIRQDHHGKYLVKNRENGKTYGSYKSKKYANIIRRILPFYRDDVKIELIEQIAIKEFYKYITYDHLEGYYRFRYENMTIMTNKSLTTLLEERDLYIKSGADEELMCEITEIYRYKEDKLPPFPHRENISYEEKLKNKYSLRKQIRSKRLKIGSYQTYDLALLVKDYLAKHNWKKSDVEYIKDITSEIQNRDKNIIKKENKYYIQHIINKKRHYYGSYKNIHIARYVRDKLKENNWNKKDLKRYEKEYDYCNKSQYYYDHTDIFTTA